jgi:serine/threonine protein phosphatase PrpC
MITCPNCQAENRSGAKFCRSCATRLPDSPAATRPLFMEAEANNDPVDPQTFRLETPTTRRLAQDQRTGTKPLHPSQAFKRRPKGAIFGDIYLYQSVIFSNESQHRYQVSLVNVSDDLQIRVCPNPECGAIFPPCNTAPEKYCTDCGKVLVEDGKNLVLVESKNQVPDNIVRVVAKGLSHGSVRAPISTFVERLGDVPRYCVVMPQTQPLESPLSSPLEPGRALKWGISLARGLDYLHDNGVSFNGKIDPTCLALVGERVVWANFSHCEHHSVGYVQERAADIKSLAQLIYHWLTGREHFEPDTRFSPALNQTFEQVLTGSSVTEGLQLAQLLENALEDLSASQAVDLRSGRCTHVGMVRTLNEDSLAVVEINRIQQSISRPTGVYVVADGMGGHAAGEVASGLIVDTIASKAVEELLSPQAQVVKPVVSDWLRMAVEAANTEVFNLRKSAGTDMGSTMVAAALIGNQAFFTHIGDSRIYLINTKGIKRLTVDHSLVERLIATHQITREEARYHPQRNVIYRTVGDKPKIEVDVTSLTLAVGDSLLLCSDGLSGMLDDEMICKFVLEANNPQAACETLIEAANAAGGQDNSSVVIVKVVES